MIQNYDTNGLVFALNHQAKEVSKTEDDETYLAALDNIIRAQQFFCIPLVSDKLPRENKNNLFDRAVYKKNAKGRVTHIARKGVFDSENDIVIMPIAKIVHLKNDDSLIEATEKLFTKNADGEYNLVITIGGQSDMPDALFSPFELTSGRTKREIERRLAMGGMKIESINKFFKMVKDVISNDSSEEDIDAIMSEFSIDNDDKILTRLRTTSQLKRDHYKGGVRASDIMTPVACGILSSGNYMSPIEKLSAKMLAIANDFDDLILMEDKDGTLTPTPKIVRVVESNQTVDVIPFNTYILKTSSMASEIVKLIQKNGGKALIVEPNPKLILGEGRMKWPAIITQQDVCSYEVIGFIGAQMITLERFLGRFLNKREIKKIKTDAGMKSVVGEASLGQLGRYISRKDGLVNQLISNKTKEGRAEFKNKIKKITKFRNQIMHNLLKTFIGLSIDKDIRYDNLIQKIDMYLKFHESTYLAVYGNKSSQSSSTNNKVIKGNNSKGSNVKLDTDRILAKEAKKNLQSDTPSQEKIDGKDMSLESRIKALEEQLKQIEDSNNSREKLELQTEIFQLRARILWGEK